MHELVTLIKNFGGLWLVLPSFRVSNLLSVRFLQKYAGTPNGKWDYLIYVEYKTKEDLENAVYDIFSEMESTADYRNCFIEASAWCEEFDMWW